MSLEQALDRLATAIEKQNALLESGVLNKPATTAAAAPATAGRPPKAEKPAAPAKEEPAKGNLFDEEEEAAPAAAEKTITEAELKEKLRQFAIDNGYEATEKLLAKFKAKKIKEIQPADYASVVAEIEKTKKKK